MNKAVVSVSVITANYNNGDYLDDFINSINNSSILPEERIIINDGSTDDSLTILEKYSSLSYLKIIAFPENKGFCNALNAGIESAKGKYIMRIDPDDIALPSRIEKQYKFLEKNHDIDVLGSNTTYFHNNTGKEIITSNFPLNHDQIKQKFYSGEHGVQHPSTMIRSSVMKKYKYDQDNFRAEDYEIFAKMINDGCKFANIKEPLTKMRVHSKSVSINISYETVKKTYEIRDRIFNTKSSLLKSRFYFWYIINYKKFLISNNNLMKAIYLSLSIIYYPGKLLNRFRKTNY